jgi:Fe-S cluster biogenesis protein NfuA
VQARVAALDRMLHSHAGGLELQSVGADGVVQVRFTGMCVGCELKPVTAACVVQPALAALEGVTAVQISGGRVSDEAQAALRASAGGMYGDTAAILRAVERFEGAPDQLPPEPPPAA